jgi:hypothetical protein
VEWELNELGTMENEIKEIEIVLNEKTDSDLK